VPPTGGPSGVPGCCACSTCLTVLRVRAQGGGCFGNVAGTSVSVKVQSTGAVVGTCTTGGEGTCDVTLPGIGTYQIVTTRSPEFTTTTTSNVTVSTACATTTRTVVLTLASGYHVCCYTYTDPISGATSTCAAVLPDTLHATVNGQAVTLTWSATDGGWQGGYMFTPAGAIGISLPQATCNIQTGLQTDVPIHVFFGCSGVTIYAPVHIDPGQPAWIPINQTVGGYPWDGPPYTACGGSAPWWGTLDSGDALVISGGTCSPFAFSQSGSVPSGWYQRVFGTTDFAATVTL
jgi:hypothetical protein